jgi:hypothetical protein
MSYTGNRQADKRHHMENGMPSYRVWYRDIPEPLEFVTASRSSEIDLLDHILAHEHIVPSVSPPGQRGDPASPAPTVQELIARNNLAPVRYTEDESEIQRIE